MLHTAKFWLTSDGRLEVYDFRLATKIEKELKRYGGYRFKVGEEAVFRLTKSEVDTILGKFLKKSK